ncbi:MAG TPA: zinc-ribbon and DUF3426 domain-containing protein [Acidiferrobacter sp.]|nr:zinc-ribbon and DUF3426 domain-containing protein [Acidiferrobacter sp.]
MILTQCPSCRTLFRLDEEDVRACGGAVRCGQCGAVFQADVYRIDEPAAETAPKTRSSGRWLALMLILLSLTLAVEALYVTRDQIARIALVRPATQLVCRYVRCRLAHPAAIDQYRLEDAQVNLGSQANLLLIRAELVNHAAFGQSLPLLSVTIFGPAKDILARVNYGETAYLRDPRIQLGPHEAAHVRLDLRVPANASGYRLALFPTRVE